MVIGTEDNHPRRRVARAHLIYANDLQAFPLESWRRGID